MSSQKGYSLVEVVASIVLISIILLSLSPMVITSKQASTGNVERLVMINLADATLDRLEKTPTDYIEEHSSNPSYLAKNNRQGVQTYTYEMCRDDDCKRVFSQSLNGKTYYFTVKASQTPQENANALINILVTVQNDKKEHDYSVEGYVYYGNELE